MVRDFFKKWKKGIMDITPFQQARIVYWNTYIMILGIKLGIFVSYRTEVWWLFIILIAALVNTLVVQLGNYQKYILLKRLESNLKGGNEDV